MSATYQQAWTHDPRPPLSGAGPWEHEPDKVHWIDAATDMDCLAVRNPMGAWCGYVGLPPGHPWHGVGYSQCLQPGCTDDACYEHSPEALTDVHGGLTFSSSCHEFDKGEGYGICHTPQPGRPADVWWFGFDCAHAGDFVPGMPTPADLEWLHDGDVYRDLAYVQTETADLARQLAAVTS